MKWLKNLFAAGVILTAGCMYHRPYDVDLASPAYPKKVQAKPGAGSIYVTDLDSGLLDIIDLNETAKVEDAWVYIKKKDGRQFWVDVGQEEKANKAQMNRQIMYNYTGEGDLVIPVHTHLTIGPPEELDFVAHAHVKEVLQKIGAKSPRALVVARGWGLVPEKIYEFDGFAPEGSKPYCTGRERKVADLSKAPAKLEIKKGSGTIYAAGRDEGENAIFDLVNSAKAEDAWAYVKKASGKKFWLDIGQEEKLDNVKVDNPLLLQYLGEGDVVELYHIHTARSLSNRHDEQMHAHVRSELEKIAGAKCPMSYTIIPKEGALEEAIIQSSGASSGSLFTSVAGSPMPRSMWEKLRKDN